MPFDGQPGTAARSASRMGPCPALPECLREWPARRQRRYASPATALMGETPVTTWPGDDIAAGKVGRGHIRASHADREQVIGVLKTAFVQGMLAKDEFDQRVGQAFASRTYAELAALTANLPAGLTPANPPQPAKAPGEPRMPRAGVVAAVATMVYGAVWLMALLLPQNSEGEPQGGLALVVLTGFCYLLLLLAAGTPILADWLNKRW